MPQQHLKKFETTSIVVHYAKVREIEALEALPMTAAGKISKLELKRLETDKFR